MRVWIDVTNSPHVQFFRPLIGLLRSRGHDVLVTAREFAQTLELLDDLAIPHEVVGPAHAGAGRTAKVRTMAGRLRALRRWARGRGIDIALSHASHELPLAARWLGVPSSYAFDYEYARIQHGIGCRAATRVVVPEAIPQARLDRLGGRSSKTRRFPGLKEEYYLADLAPDPRALDELGLDPSRVIAIVRTPPEVSLYHLHGNPLFDSVLTRLGSAPGVQAVALPRTPAQAERLRALGLPSLVVPERAVDAPALVAQADVVVSAGGTMNREAAALGVPVWTAFAERMGAIDEALVREGRLHVLTAADDVTLVKRSGARQRTRRDPALLLDLMLSALA